ncbi:hypothetical protein GCM10010151_57480 [Actinoallomurus spadix]|uniref:Uncharacterized protein n=1 Tax=Actinoallomurus spadix TaxID=79912 RepID=A0ABN0XBJ0_9ACTN
MRLDPVGGVPPGGVADQALLVRELIVHTQQIHRSSQELADAGRAEGDARRHSVRRRADPAVRGLSGTRQGNPSWWKAPSAGTIEA